MDPRIPVLFGRPGEPIAPETGVLVADHQEVPGAAAVARVARQAPDLAACACCAPRGDVARALSRLFLARARGEVGFFRQVVVRTAALEPEVRAALAGDVLVAARYRLAG